MNLVFIKSFRKFSREFSVFIDLNVYLNGYGKSVYRKWWSFAKHYATAFDSNITIVNLIVILSGWIWTSLDSYVSEFFVSVNFSFWNSLISLPFLLPFCKSCKRNNTDFPWKCTLSKSWLICYSTLIFFCEEKGNYI